MSKNWIESQKYLLLIKILFKNLTVTAINRYETASQTQEMLLIVFTAHGPEKISVIFMK